MQMLAIPGKTSSAKNFLGVNFSLLAGLLCNAQSLFAADVSTVGADILPLVFTPNHVAGILALALMSFLLGKALSQPINSFWRLMALVVAIEVVIVLALIELALIGNNLVVGSVLNSLLVMTFIAPLVWNFQKNIRALGSEKKRSEATLSSIGDGVIVVDAVGRVEFLNPLAQELLGYTLEQTKSQAINTICKLINADTLEPVENPVFRVLCGGIATEMPKHMLLVRADGRETPVEDSASPILNGNQEVTGVVLVFRDISHRIQQEALLRQTEELWNLALEANNDGLWDWNLQTGKVWFSPRYHEMYGYEEGELAGDYSEWVQSLHPQDKDFVFDALKQVLQGALPKFDIEYRCHCKKGQWKWVHASGKVVSHDTDGNPLRMVGTHRDIDERKAQEEELRLAASVFEQNSESIIIMRAPSKEIVKVNPAFSETTGYNPEEVLGGDLTFLRSGKHDDAFYEAVFDDVRSKGVWRGEIWRKRKNDEVYPEWVTITSIKDSHDIVCNYVCISSDISESKEAEEKIRDLAYYDTLTGLPNRRLLEDRLRLALANAHRNDKLVALLFMDLDHFKLVNDSLGHLAGDNLLKQTTKRILACVREGDTVARQGGDEFVLLLPDLNSNGDALFAASTVGEKIRDALSAPFNLDGFEASVTPSIGISIYPSDTDNMAELIRNADTAMYFAKNNGRNNYQFYANEMNASSNERLDMDNALRYAIERNELSLVYQPQVDASGHILSAEALLRWNSRTLGEVPPSQFIPIAEENGLILSIGKWVLETACAQKRIWLDMNLCAEMARIAINISARQFAQPNFVNQLLQIIEHQGVPASSIELEMTEGMLMRDTNDTQKKLAELKSLGFKISIDDFGTGYSSLAYLKHFPIDVLKIDQSFVRDLETDPDDAAISRAIISMGKNLNLTVIAEGVETLHQLDFLHANGCDAYQGFHFNRPMSASDLTHKLKNYPNK